MGIFQLQFDEIQSYKWFNGNKWPLTIYISIVDEFQLNFRRLLPTTAVSTTVFRRSFMHNSKDIDSLTEFKVFTEFSLLFSMKSFICCVNTLAS